MERQQIFQRLSQPCIQLLQETARLAQDPGARKDLVQALTSLLSTLQAITATPNVLDAKLTEYAFVPISQVLRISRRVPVRALELCLKCISVLLCAGWGGSLDPALSGQLLILFTFLAKPLSEESGIAATSEELQSLAFRCMAELMTEMSRTQQNLRAMTATANIPALSEAILVMLDSLTDNGSNDVKLRVTLALKALINALPDDDALASFLPKIVSSLTKVLTPRSSNRPGFRVIEQSLELFCSLLLRLLSDRSTGSLPNRAPHEKLENVATITRSKSWVQATASQMRIALANVFKLRDHDKSEVRQALLQLCLCIIQDCRNSLPDCTSMAIETTISLVGYEGSQDKNEDRLKESLCTDQHLSNALIESLHGWIMALPRLMQSKDDRSRHRIIHQISVTLRISEQDSTTINEKLAESLRDSVSMVFGASEGLEELVGKTENLSSDHALILASGKAPSFKELQLRYKGQDDTMAEFKLLLQEVAKADSALTVAQELTRSMDLGTLETRLASFWISVNLIREIATNRQSLDDFIDLGTPSLREEILDTLYAHSLTILNEREETIDTPWHFYALALETVTLQASRYRTEFRLELSEVLYPVLHHLGSSNAALREHALTCLNIISKSSEYSNAGELVVANVDYIVNAVGLKLATGDVSPQAPQVLLMMMRLCGPSLLPYLDDLVGSIFDALERYHGYPKLAELLFSVLKGIAEEGVKTPQFALIAGDKDPPHHDRKKVDTMEDVVQALQRVEADSRTRDEESEAWSTESVPQEPWKDATTTVDEDQGDTMTEGRSPSGIKSEEIPTPAPRTFDILLKISELTQHYLTTNSPSLRNSLLSLLRTTIPALAKHEDSFLPLINTLWPVLLPRLQDPEGYIVSSTLETVALICEHAGSFMRTRIDDSWDIFRKVYRRTKHQTETYSKNSNFLFRSLSISAVETNMTKLSMKSVSTTESFRPDLYVDAPTRMIWKSLVTVLNAIARHVTIQEERFDEMLDILDPVLEKSDVREAMEQCNADSVWLRLYKKSKPRIRNTQNDNHSPHRMFASTTKTPVGRPRWHFVKL